MVISGYCSYAQKDLGTDETAPRLVFNQADFGERFAVLANDDQDYNYFVTDLTKLPTHFQKVYFLNLVFNDRQVISIDSDLSKDQLWFKVPATIAEHDALCKFDDLKAETAKAEASMTPEQRQTWLSGYDKFQKPNN
jgi:hypothetical protein